jgi:5'-nucleotidase
VTLALNNYRQTGGGGFAMLAGAPLVHDEQAEIRQLLIDEVTRRRTIRPEDYARRNWELVPAAAAAAALAEMTGTASPSPSARRPAATRLRILATNDFHGALEPRPDNNGLLRGGAAFRSTLIERLRAECIAPACESILLDGGDMWQGTPASNLAFGKPVVTLYDHDGYAASALGNHEFDWGTDVIRERMKEARFNILGANVRYADGTDVEWIPNDTLVRRGAITVGVIGLATVHTPTTTRAKNVAGLRFDPPAPIVDSTARALRARGATVVVVIAHAGGFCGRNGTGSCDGEIFDLARTVTEPIDAVVAGHTHALLNTVVNGIPIVQARSRGSALGVIDLEISQASNGWEGSRAVAEAGFGGRVLDVLPDSLPPHPEVDTLVRKAVSAVAEIVTRPVARFAAAMPKEGEQFALGNYIADAQRWAGKADVAVMNNGGIRTGVRAGSATYGSLFEVQPFANTLHKLTLSGAELRGYLERLLLREPPHAHASGVTVTYDPSRAAGSRIISVRMHDGTPLRDTGTYTLVINDFMVTGGDGLGLAERGITAVPLNIVDLEALIDYSKSRPQPVAPPAELRFVPVAR